MWKLEKKKYTNVIITIDPEEKEKLAIEGGDPAEDLHVTLIFLGEAADMDKKEQESLKIILEAFSKECEPLSGNIPGVSTFPSQDGPPAQVALVSVLGLSELRTNLKNRLIDAGFEINDKYGFVPHITLAYQETLIEKPTQQLHFNKITLRVAGKITDFEFGKGAKKESNWRIMANNEEIEFAKKVYSYMKEDPAAYMAFQQLSQYGDVFVVGGAPRDILLGKAPKDIDLMAQVDPEIIEGVLKSIPDSSLTLAGKNFGVYHFHYDHSTVEIALPRTEQSTGGGHKDFEVQADHTMPVEEDLPRRDFSVNSIAVNLNTGEVVDPLDGQKDIKAGILRHNSPNSFTDDPLRLIRAMTSHGRHGFVPAPETAQAIRESAHLIRNLPGERIQEELNKILKSKHPEKAITMAHELGILEHFLPEVANTFGFDQQNAHHQHDLGTHLMEVLRHTKELTNDDDIRLAALLHDIGKPASQWFDENGVGHYYKGDKGQGQNHEEVGAQMTEDAMRRLRYPAQRINNVSNLVRHHMFPAFNTARGARKFLNRMGTPETANDLLTLRQADHEGKGTHGTNSFMVNNMRNLVDQQANQPAYTLQNLNVTGRDVINVLNLPPGPRVGEILKKLLDYVIENPELNTRANLIQILQGMK